MEEDTHTLTHLSTHATYNALGSKRVACRTPWPVAHQLGASNFISRSSKATMCAGLKQLEYCMQHDPFEFMSAGITAQAIQKPAL